MAERMAFILDGSDQLSPVFRRIGESADRFHRRINDAVDNSNGSMQAFVRDGNGGLRELEGSMAAAGRAATSMGGHAAAAAPEVRALGEAADSADDSITRLTRGADGRVRDMRGRFVTAAVAAEHLARTSGDASAEITNVGTAADSASRSTARLDRSSRDASSSVGRLGEAAKDAAVEAGGKGGGLGGAMTGVAAIVGLSLLPALGAVVPMLAGAGVAAGTMKLGFSGISEAMEAAGKGKKEYAAALKELTPEARAFTKELVSTKKEFQGVGDKIQEVMLPGFTKALKEADPVIRIVSDAMVKMGTGFGDAAAGVGRLMKDSGFQGEFTNVLRLGGIFVKDLTGGLGGLARGFLHFGSTSESTLRSLSTGLSGLLGQGLPGMFAGLERGAAGTSALLDGLFEMLGQVIPALGRFSGEVARTFGPYLGQTMIFFGRVTTNALDGIGMAVRVLSPVFEDLTYGMKALMIVGDIFAASFKLAGRAIINSFLPSLDGVRKAQGPLQKLHGWVVENKLGFMALGQFAANAIVSFVETGVVSLPILIGAFRMMSTMVLESLGVIINGAATAFSWIPGIGDSLKNAANSFNGFKTTFIAGLNAAQQKTAEFSANVGPKLARNKLEMNITSWQAQISAANEKLKTVPPSKKADLLAYKGDLEAKVAQAKRDLKSIPDETVYIRVLKVMQTIMPFAGYMPGFATGGLIRGPGTSTSDSIPHMASDGEYMIRAASVSRFGVGFFDALNEGKLPAVGGQSVMPASSMAARSGGGGVTFAPQITVQGALDPVAVAQQLRRMLLELQRTYGLETGVIMR